MNKREKSEKLFEKACKLIPRGVNSPVRAFGQVGGTPVFMKRGDGAYLYDADGSRYIDYCQSWGASILGHAHPDVVKAVADQAAKGTSFGIPTELEIKLAEIIISNFKKIEMIRFGEEKLSVKKTIDVRVLDVPVPGMILSVPGHVGSTFVAMRRAPDIIASWIMKTPFAKSLFNIIPGIGYMIFLGHIIWMLEQDEDLTIVMDSQSSGHAITMFESPYNFKKIFGTGIVVNDIHKITSFMTNPDKIKVFVANLANPMSVSEGDELKNYLKKLSTPNIQLIMNNTFGNIPEIERSGKLPKFINKKILLEKKVYKSYQKQDIYILPHMIDSSQEKIIQKLVPYAEKLM